ncbi:MAG: adenosylmethionine decarboxylase [Chloroflexi bacterium]|nr:adenosylmethionine decarboxylase [Chloroflexota bacterium]
MNALGTHLLLELKGCNRQLLDDLPYIQESLLRAAEVAGVRVLGHTFHKFSPHGVTGIVAIAESHISIHTWPEFEYASVDIFTCGDHLHPMEAAQSIIQRLESREPSIMEIRRGFVSLPLGVSRG